MKIAIPTYNDNVSSVFDFAHRLLLVDIKNGKEANRSEFALESQLLAQRTGQLKNLGVDVLVCGHTHSRGEHVTQSNGRGHVLYKLGDWATNGCYLLYKDDRFQFLHSEG